MKNNIKHCIKCHGFAWWDGDFCCTKRMSIMEGAENGKFWAELPDAFDANNCEDYDFNENYANDVHDYYGQYCEFLLEKHGYKHYDKKQQ